MRMSRSSNSKEFIAGVFNRASATYDNVGPSFFSHFGEVLVERAGLLKGQGVLDVATGHGAVLMPAAKAVGAYGHVIGTDLASEMVERAKVEAHRQGFYNVDTMCMDAEELEFSDETFDVVFCGFSIILLPDPAKALREFARVLRPGGRLAVSTWADDCEFFNWLNFMFGPYMPEAYPQPLDRRFSLNTREGLGRSLEVSGFDDIEVSVCGKDFVYANDEEVWASLWSHGFRASLEAIDASGDESFKEIFHRDLAWLKQRDGIHAPMSALLGVARKSA